MPWPYHPSLPFRSPRVPFGMLSSTLSVTSHFLFVHQGKHHIALPRTLFSNAALLVSYLLLEHHLALLALPLAASPTNTLRHSPSLSAHAVLSRSTRLFLEHTLHRYTSCLTLCAATRASARLAHPCIDTKPSPASSMHMHRPSSLHRRCCIMPRVVHRSAVTWLCRLITVPPITPRVALFALCAVWPLVAFHLERHSIIALPHVHQGELSLVPSHLCYRRTPPKRHLALLALPAMHQAASTNGTPRLSPSCLDFEDTPSYTDLFGLPCLLHALSLASTPPLNGPSASCIPQ